MKEDWDDDEWIHGRYSTKGMLGCDLDWGLRSIFCQNESR